MTPGYKTTEFWVSLLAMLVGVLMTSGAFGNEGVATQILGVIASSLGALGYAVPRAMVKAKSVKPPKDV
jgi:drug/metabolite transporter (DMT)-like permease